MAVPNIDRLNREQLLELEQEVDALLAQRRADAVSYTHLTLPTS